VIAVKSFSLAVLALLLATSAAAQRRTFTANPSASQITMTLHTTHEVVNGVFHLQSGAITFDPANSTLSGSILVLAGSGTTGNSARDKRMNNSILLVDQHATVAFAPTSYTGTLAPTGDSTLQVTGIFTLLGIPHPITIPILVHLAGSTASAKAHLLIPYVQWGVKDPSFLIWKADKQVTVDLTLTGAVSP
jgi:polyisoprenoid-binding protein YceI